MSSLKLTPELLLAAYIQGIFPMSHNGELFWYDPDPRAILPLDQLHVSRSLKRVMKRVWVVEADKSKRRFLPETINRSTKMPFEVRVNSDFGQVLGHCADPRRPGAWINDDIIESYTRLHELGWAHSVETWQDGQLVGGLYGVAVRGLFAGEAMFSHAAEASKVALVYLVHHLNVRGFTLLDVQFNTDHLAQFGVANISRDAYKTRLAQALSVHCTFS